MKKMITSFTLGSLLLVGLAFMQYSQPSDLTTDMEPSILSVERPSTLL
ncbi:hypothetical protein [Virgibacillus sp. CBA3643]